MGTVHSMDETEARQLLELKLAADRVPTFTETEVAALLNLARMVDPLGKLPGDTDYIPTWNVDAAAAEGWRWRAGKVAGGYDLRAASGAALTRSQYHAHCLAMAALFDTAAAQAAQAAFDAAEAASWGFPSWVVNI